MWTPKEADQVDGEVAEKMSTSYTSLGRVRDASTPIG